MYFINVGIKACMEEKNPVEEQPYEIGVDNQGCQGGPRAGRLRALANVSILVASYVHVNCEGMTCFSCSVKNYNIK